MRKSVRILMVFLVFVLLISVVNCVSAAKDNSTEVQTVSKGGVVVKFPSDWCVAKSDSNASVVSIADSSSINSDKVAGVTINIEKKAVKGNFDSFVNSTYTSMQKDSSFNLSSSGAVAVGEMEGVEYTYTSDINGTVKEHRAIWIDDNNEAYVILYSAPPDQFDSDMKVFDYVVHNLQINA